MVFSDLFSADVFCMCGGASRKRSPGTKPGTKAMVAAPKDGTAAPADSNAPPLEQTTNKIQCSLIFSSNDGGGCFMLQWSEGPVPEHALAAFIPTKPVPQYKLKNEGKSELMRDAGGANARKFYEGWVSFVRTAIAYDSKMRFIKNLDYRPIALYVLDTTNSVRKHPFGAELEFSNVQCLAIVPYLSRDLDVLKMNPSMFKGAGERIGCTIGDLELIKNRNSSASPVEPSGQSPRLCTSANGAGGLTQAGAEQQAAAAMPVAPGAVAGAGDASS